MVTSIRIGIALAAVLGLAACGERDSDERSAVERLAANNIVAPEEFAVLPQKPLELPEDLTALPEPQPGTVSRVDLTPEADALVALGGRPGRSAPVSGDRALLAAAGAGLARPDIRDVLVREDAIYRSNNRGRLLERLFSRDTENFIYSGQSLNAERELLRLRALGILVPQLPPAP